MTDKVGRWTLWSRGTDPKPWTQWVEQPVEDMEFAEILYLFLQWKKQGQNVRLEWYYPGRDGGPWPSEVKWHET